MSIEIERRFKVIGDCWRKLAKPVDYLQGYLSVDPMRTVRVRVVGDNAWMTIKSKVTDISRFEFEYSIPCSDATTILNDLCELKIKKQRTTFSLNGNIWEIDEFFGDNNGLVLAEIELSSETSTFNKPEWLGEEVTHDGRFTNAYLADHPYRFWPDNVSMLKGKS